MDLEAWKGLILAAGCILISEEENEPIGTWQGQILDLEEEGQRKAYKTKQLTCMNIKGRKNAENAENVKPKCEITMHSQERVLEGWISSTLSVYPVLEY